MEKIIVITIVFVSIGLLIWYLVKSFKNKDSCYGCSDHSKCARVGCGY